MQDTGLLKEHELEKWRLGDFQEQERAIGSQYSRKIGIVCGCGRSGTTLTRVLLDSHTKVYAGLESLLFLPIPIIASTLAKKFTLPVELIEEQLKASKNKGEFIEWFIGEVLQNNSKELFVDKTARNLHVLPDIWRMYPNALVIHVLRGPIDTISSLITHPKRMYGGPLGEDIAETGIEHDLQPCIDRWRLAAQAALEHKGDSRFYTIRYEDLVLHTASTIRGVCDFLGVSFESDMLDFTSKNTLPTRNPALGFAQNIEATKPISIDSIGRGYAKFSPNIKKEIRKQTDRIFNSLII